MKSLGPSSVDGNRLRRLPSTRSWQPVQGHRIETLARAGVFGIVVGAHAGEGIRW